MASSSAFTTFFMRMRLEWNVKRPSSRAKRAGISVSIVVLELGTIWPMRRAGRSGMPRYHIGFWLRYTRRMKPLRVILGVMTIPVWALAQQTPPAVVFDQACARCHETGTTASKLDRQALVKIASEAIYESLTAGSMRDQVPDLSGDTKRAVAEYLGGKKLGIAVIADARSMPNQCAANPIGRA